MASYIENLRFSDRNASDIGADDGLPPYNNDTFTTTYTETKSCAIGKDGIRINYDLDTATPKYFEMTKDGVVFAETGQPTYTTGLGRLCAVQQAFQAVELPPNSTTLKINDTVLVSAGVANQTTTINDGNITIQGTGLNNNPLLSLNTGTGNGVLYQEVYNQRTAQTGEFSRMSFYAKNSTGTKTEYARIHQNAPVITAGAVKGRIDFSVGAGAGLQDYLSLNANTGQVDILNSTLHLNNNNISNANTISTPLTNYYGKQINPVFLSAHTSISTNVENYARYNAFNAGRTATWDNSNINDFSSAGFGVENITASIYTFNGAWVVGTENGNIFYTYDSGTTWGWAGNVGGKINCFCPISGGGSLAVGGVFSGGTYDYLCGLSSGWSLYDITGYGGLNGAVYCMNDDFYHYGMIQIGGAFTDFKGGSGGSFYGFVAYNWNTSGYYPLNNYGGGGFTGGEVRSIAYDGNFMIVGGLFTDQNISGSSGGIPYLFTFQTSDGYSVSGYFGIGLPLNGYVYAVIPDNSSGFLVGGDFTNTSGYSFCNTNYGMRIYWNGGNWDLYDYTPYSPTGNISSITYIPWTGAFYTIQNGNTIYQSATQLPLPIPAGSSWYCIMYNGSNTLFSTNGQTSVGFILYYLNNSLVITISSPTYNVITYSGSYTTINLQGFGSAIECMYYNGSWWVVSNVGCSFS